MKILHTSVFEDAEGYERARIPGIVCTDNGKLIAYCELRRSDSDWAVIDIGMKKSSDGGKTWSERKILVSGENKNTVNNPVMITDGDTLHFLYCVNYKRVFYMKSTDEGESWTDKTELTDSLRRNAEDFFFSCIAVGPTHGIRLSSGRLLVPIWMAYNKEDEKSHHPSVISVIFSDDRGKSWKTGKIFDGLSDPSEFAVAEIRGEIIASIRHENRDRFRAMGKISADGEIYDVRLTEFLPDPVCCGGLFSYENELLFSNCASETDRENLVLRRLTADMRETDSILISKDAGYSDVCAELSGKTAFVLYEKQKQLILTAVSLM